MATYQHVHNVHIVHIINSLTLCQGAIGQRNLQRRQAAVGTCIRLRHVTDATFQCWQQSRRKTKLQELGNIWQHLATGQRVGNPGHIMTFKACYFADFKPQVSSWTRAPTSALRTVPYLLKIYFTFRSCVSPFLKSHMFGCLGLLLSKGWQEMTRGPCRDYERHCFNWYQCGDCAECSLQTKIRTYQDHRSKKRLWPPTKPAPLSLWYLLASFEPKSKGLEKQRPNSWNKNRTN